uniref:TonB-dependent transporter Oar-like beta-barrel domain-containing protein n=1 Tax=Solibacter usitatus (strain Ellin6076) TaxID=234267 RepID=Q01SF8_SOLUE
MNHTRGFVLAAVLVLGVAGLASPPQAGLNFEVSVVDQAKLAVPAVRVQLKSGDTAPRAVDTDTQGKAVFRDLKPAAYHLSILLKGFEPVERDIEIAPGGPLLLDVTLSPALERTQIEVKGEASTVEQGSSPATSITGQLAKQLPTRPATVAEALPLVPGVVRDPGGGLRISDSPESRSALIVNSADVTDPGTGQFGLTVPIDSVETLNVYQTAFLAEYGRFTAGLVSVETKRGGDKWKWELNDPFPEFRIRSWQLRGLKTATPRLNFEGPIIPGKLYMAEGFEYEIRKTEVYTLPFPRNQKLQEGLNSFTQLDWVASSKQLLTATFHVVPQRLAHVNINYFNPEETAPDASLHNYTGTVAHRMTLGQSLFENTFSITSFDVGVWGLGDADLVLTPTVNYGNYYAQKQRTAMRLSGLSTFAFAPVHGLGIHHYKIGLYVASSEEDGQIDEHPVDLLDAAGVLTERITFNRPRTFEISDIETNFFAQDHWIISPRLSLDMGARVESQQVSGAYRVAPRAGFAWNPFPGQSTTVRGGFGFFYDRVPLNVYVFNKYPDQIQTFYNANGDISAGPFLYLNTLGQIRVRHPFVIQEPKDGNFSPQSVNWTMQIEQPVGRYLKLRTGYMQSRSEGLVILNPVAPDPDTGFGAHLLSGTGGSLYHQFETTARLRVGESHELFFSYVRSKGRGDLNDFGTFLGTFPTPIVRPNLIGNSPSDLPNRFLAWGMWHLPWKFRISPVIEYRSGFPYITTDAAQNYFGQPNDRRFPRFFSLDSRLSKDFQVTKSYAVRLAVSGFNLTNHFNPEAVHANIADPAFGYFFGHRGRRFTLDFDVLF